VKKILAFLIATAFLSVFTISRVLYAKDKKGKILMALPADHILWSERFAGAVSEVMEKAK